MRYLPLMLQLLLLMPIKLMFMNQPLQIIYDGMFAVS